MKSEIIQGDCIEGMRTLPDASVHCCVTSPPYWGLRDYGHAGQIGLEDTPEAYVARMVAVFREVRRVLRDDGTCWLNLGDSYTSTAQGTLNAPQPKGSRHHADQWANRRPITGLKPKDLVGIPWRVAFALQADGWWLRQDIIWAKPNPMPESVRDRCTKAHEYVFLLTKSERYFYDAEAIKVEASKATADRNRYGFSGAFKGQFAGTPGEDRWQEGRPIESPAFAADGKANRRSVWTVTTKPYRGAHFATMPPDLVEPCIKAGTSEEGCCRSCGAPFVRVVERARVSTRPGKSTKVTGDGLTDGNRDPQRHVTSTKTTGWSPSCSCGSGLVPCTVLDPFAGSGTTLAVAAELGRSGIGCELNPAYICLAEKRLAQSSAKLPLF